MGGLFPTFRRCSSQDLNAGSVMPGSSSEGDEREEGEAEMEESERIKGSTPPIQG